MTDNKNTILAIVLSALVLLGWQYFFAVPQEKARQEQLQAQKQNLQTPAQPGQPSQPPTQSGTPQIPGQAGTPAAAATVDRAAALAASPRVADRNRQPARLDRTEGRTYRRPGAGQVS